MFKKIPVVMLPTEKASKIVKGDITGRLLLHNKEGFSTDLNTTQHFHFLSDEEPKEGEWCYVENKLLIKNDYEILKVKSIKYVQGVVGYKEVSFYKSTLKIAIRYCKKIIATTDEYLLITKSDEIPFNETKYTDSLPQPPQSFKERFIEKYNAGTPITHVMVEYEPCEYVGDIFKGEEPYPTNWKLRINPKDNTIIIKPIKNSLNRKEIISFIMTMTSTPSSISKETAELMLDKWIEQTYKV